MNVHIQWDVNVKRMWQRFRTLNSHMSVSVANLVKEDVSWPRMICSSCSGRDLHHPAEGQSEINSQLYQ